MRKAGPGWSRPLALLASVSLRCRDRLPQESAYLGMRYLDSRGIIIEVTPTDRVLRGATLRGPGTIKLKTLAYGSLDPLFPEPLGIGPFRDHRILRTR